MSKLITDVATLKLIAFAVADTGKSLLPSDARTVLETAPSGSFVDLTTEVLAVDADFLALATMPKLSKSDKARRTRVNAAIARSVKRLDESRTVSAFRFIADKDGKPAGYGCIIG